VVPALASSALLVLIVGSSLFSIPRTIGTAAGIDTVSVYIVRLTQVYPAKLDQAMAVSVLLLVVLGIAWWLQQRVARQGRHATISGKSGSAATIDLGRWRGPARLLMTLYVLCVSVLPFLALLVVALQPYWSSTIDPARLTLDNFRDFFGLKGALPRRALTTSILLGVVGATISMAVVSVMVHYSRERRGFVSRLVEGITKIPGAISHIVFGVAILVTFAGPPFNLSGTLTILLLAYYVIYLPQASTGAEVARGQVGNELLEASSMLGASRFQTFRRILLPLMMPGLTAGWALMFVVIVGDLTASAILAGHTNPVVSFVFLDIWDNGTFSTLATLGVLVSLVTSAVVVGALVLGRRAAFSGSNPPRAGGG
jgi:iron(III) transport system permease protein